MNNTRIKQTVIVPIAPIKRLAWPNDGTPSGQGTSQKRPELNRQYEPDASDDEPDKPVHIDRYI